MAASDVSKKRKAPKTTDTATPPKKVKKSTPTPAVREPAAPARLARDKISTKPKGNSAAKKTGPAPTPNAQTPAAEPAAKPTEDDFEAFDDNEDDQTAALLKGFESSDDEDDAAVDSTNPDAPSNAITEIPTIPSSTALEKSLKSANNKQSQEPGTLYLSRLPHGFHEPQLRSYFVQFGHITHLRLCRNRRTGAPKHYAFLQFASAEVAQIVADTMDNYLMFGHLLKVKVVPPGDVKEGLWKGGEGRFKKVPWNRIERYRIKETDRKGWEQRTTREETRRREKAEKLKTLGYEFESPELRKVGDVPVQEVKERKALEPVADTAKTVQEAEVAAIENGAGVEAAKDTQGPVSAEPMAIETAPQGDVSAPVTEQEDGMAVGTDKAEMAIKGKKIRDGGMAPAKGAEKSKARAVSAQLPGKKGKGDGKTAGKPVGGKVAKGRKSL